jgi:uncharacterized protein (TIGR00661 family)
MAKYLFMYVSGGAGHVGRSLTIANYLRDIEPDSEIVFAGGKVGKGMVEENGFRFIELETPEYFEDNRPTSNVLRLARIYLRNIKNYKKVIRDVNPDIVVVDTEPVFVFISKSLGFRTVFINHEIIPLWVNDIGPISRRIRDCIIKKTNRKSDAIVFPNIMGIEPDDGIKDKCKVVGPLGYTKFEKVRLEGKNKVLIVPSATGSIPSELLRSIQDMGYDVYVRGKGKNTGNIRYLEKTKNLMSYMDACDVVICSGYSTIMEAVSLGKPVVIYPKTEEQRIVGKLCEKSGVALYAESPEEVVNALKRLLSDEKLSEELVKRQRKYQNGSEEAAEFLMKMARTGKSLK